MLPKVVKQNGPHELFMNTYVVGQRYYYIDNNNRSRGNGKSRSMGYFNPFTGDFFFSIDLKVFKNA